MIFFRRSKHNCYCAFCRTPRWIVRRKHVGFANVAISALAAGAAMLAVWGGFDPRVSIFFAGFLAFAEMFIQVRWRLGVVCKTCGFDPILYLKNPSAAAAKVKSRLDARKNDPAALLARPLNLPRLPAERLAEIAELEGRKAKSPGALLSKSI